MMICGMLTILMNTPMEKQSSVKSYDGCRLGCSIDTRLVIVFMILAHSILAQPKPLSDCNTIFICIDSVSYRQLFANSYIKDTLFFCREATTNTLNDSYTGKYAIGKAANLEFFKPSEQDKIGNHLNDFGIEFKTRTLGDLQKLQQIAQQQKVAIDTNTTQLTEEDIVLVWYKTLKVKRTKTNFELSIIEYQKVYLKYLGFTDAEIASPMTFDYFNQKLSHGRKYPRQFNKIRAITLQINKTEMPYFKQFCVLNQMKQTRNSFYSPDLSIDYVVVDTPLPTKIKKIKVELINPQAKRNIRVSNNLSFNINQKNCEIVF
jgi:hypothetical protein